MNHTEASPGEEVLSVDGELELHAVSERFIDPLLEVIVRHREWLQQSMNWPAEVKGRADIERTVRGNMMLHQRGYSKMYMLLVAGELVGVLSFNQIEPNNKTAYIGYWRSPDCPRKGVVSQALQKVMAHYSAAGIIRRFVIKCIVTNEASNQLARRNGFQLEGRMREAEFLNGSYHDQHIYGCIIDPASDNQ